MPRCCPPRLSLRCSFCAHFRETGQGEEGGRDWQRCWWWHEEGLGAPVAADAHQQQGKHPQRKRCKSRTKWKVTQPSLETRQHCRDSCPCPSQPVVERCGWCRKHKHQMSSSTGGSKWRGCLHGPWLCRRRTRRGEADFATKTLKLFPK